MSNQRWWEEENVPVEGLQKFCFNLNDLYHIYLNLIKCWQYDWFCLNYLSHRGCVYHAFVWS